jgi:hypothetical protein
MEQFSQNYQQIPQNQQAMKYKTGFFGLFISLTIIFFTFERIIAVHLFDFDLHPITFCIAFGLLFLKLYIYFLYRVCEVLSYTADLFYRLIKRFLSIYF